MVLCMLISQPVQFSHQNKTIRWETASDTNAKVPCVDAQTTDPRPVSFGVLHSSVAVLTSGIGPLFF